jgi:hypothetical protein
VLTIVGPGPRGEFETVLRTLQYFNNAFFPSPASRTIQVVADDGVNVSLPATATVSFVGAQQAPILDLNGPGFGTGFTATVQTPGPVTVNITDTLSATPFSDSDSTHLSYLGCGLSLTRQATRRRSGNSCSPILHRHFAAGHQFA